MSDRKLVPSQRSTTSSRPPGRINRGTVWTEARALVRCGDCGGLWMGGEVHARHWTDKEGGKVLVNCIGKEVAW
jgi:hypothetical protein